MTAGQGAWRRLLMASVAAIVLVGVLIIGTPVAQDIVQPSWNCGREHLDLAAGSVTATDVRQCILAAYRQHTRAHSEHVRPTMEGDLITYVIRLKGRDDLELTIDTTKDRYGQGRIVHYRCNGMTGSEGGSFSLRLLGCGERLALIDIP